MDFLIEFMSNIMYTNKDKFFKPKSLLCGFIAHREIFTIDSVIKENKSKEIK